MADQTPPSPPPIGLALAHDSARLHVTGAALYTDDIPEPRGMLHAALALSREAHGELAAVDLGPARALLGDAGVAIVAADIPGRNDVGPISGPEPILADAIVEYVGQPIAAVAAPSLE
ncbi:MAG: xanthine dehydrogenase molybdopterin binding subunit, partial [Rhodospirillales bacterium]